MDWKAKKALYLVLEVTEELSCHRDTVYELVAIGELTAHQRVPGKKGMRITGLSLENYINRYQRSVAAC